MLNEIIFIISFFLFTAIINIIVSDYLVSLLIISMAYCLYKICISYLLKIIYKRTKINIEKYYILKCKSIYYFTDLYFPYIRYSYIINNKKFYSTKIYLDVKSFYATSIYSYEISSLNDKIKYANDKINFLLKQRVNYYNPFLKNISCLDIIISKYRKRYFISLLFTCILLGIVLKV